jgi:uncharacterized protein YgiM (DUF1202 family)
MNILKTFATFLLTGASFALFAQTKMVVTAKAGLVLRQEANEKSAKLATVAEGKEVEASDPVTKTKETLNGKKGNWRKCTFEGKTGYMFDAFLVEADEPTFDEPQFPWYVTSNAGLIMRKSASQKAEKIQTIPYATKLEAGDVGEAENGETISGVIGNWRKVRYKGKEGYVFDGYLDMEKPEPKPKK